MTPRRKLLFLIIAFAGAATDILTKWLAFRMSVHKTALIDGFLYLRTTTNRGAAFSILEGRAGLFIFISIVAMLIIAGYVLFHRRAAKLIVVALACTTGGVIGNFCDRVANTGGAVRDFILIQWGSKQIWPIFNIADILITVGVVLILLHVLFARPTRVEESYEDLVEEIPPPWEESTGKKGDGGKGEGETGGSGDGETVSSGTPAG